jgi:hypothetical protein
MTENITSKYIEKDETLYIYENDELIVEYEIGCLKAFNQMQTGGKLFYALVVHLTLNTHMVVWNDTKVHELLKNTEVL